MENEGVVSRPKSFEPNLPVCNCKIKTQNLNIYLHSSLTKGSHSANGKGKKKMKKEKEIHLESYEGKLSFSRMEAGGLLQ